jgi:signal transduction histidine kinase/CheY-like chemotaxis protein
LGAALVALCYYYIGWVTSGSGALVPMSLPLSTLSILLMSIAGTEVVMLVQNLKARQIEISLDKARDQELAQQRAAERHQILNQISRTLLDKLDISQMPPIVLTNIAKLFDADLVVIWVLDPRNSAQYICRGAHGLTGHSLDDITTVAWTFPQYADTKQFSQIILTDPGLGLTSTLLTFSDREAVQSLVLSPIVRRDLLAGVVGTFYRKQATIENGLAEEMQTVANLIGGVVQAEELYHDLVRMQKIESIGTLASGIAHDFNNVLAAILACATYCRQHADPDTQSFRYLEAIELGTHRGAALTKQLLSFVRREPPRLQVVNVNDQIDHTMQLLERSLDKSILLQRQYARDLHPVEVDPSMLEQVILNIAVNARDAMATGGFFSILTKNVGLHKENPYRPTIALPDGDYVVLGFRDTGHGMPAEVQQRIFEPFFTTKGPGKGTGLGLSLILNIVRNFGGDIRVESEVGVGTLFEIYLPASTKPLPQLAPVRTGPERGGSECVLLAEDEEIIREMAQLELEAKGYRVLTAADGAAAVARYRENADKIDLVVIDMAMPRLSGPEVFEALKKINPNVRVVVSSGYSQEQEGQRMLQHGCLGFLQKPYNGGQLCRTVRSILDSGL